MAEVAAVGATGTGRVVRIGNGQGFWGDSARGPAQLVRGGGIDYLTMDYLAEVTMSILQKMRARDPEAGYATDIVRQLEQVLPECAQHGIRVVANAGGVNPEACARAVRGVVRRLGLDLTAATVSGDDVLPRLDDLLADGHDLRHLTTGESLAAHRDRVRCANAYLGAFPIAQALDRGADVVITGRVADASLTVGPLIHEFGWGRDDFDLLAAATVAGHVIECGTQCTGGNLDRWREVPDLETIGYPVVEVTADGVTVVTKKPGTGGLVDRDTVTAQLLYEIGDPARYLTPDVVADFTTVELAEDGPDRVRVSGVRGTPPTDTLKVSVGLQRGWKVTGQLTVGGPDAALKAELTARLLFARLAEHPAGPVTFPDEDRLVEVLGTTVLYAGMVPAAAEPPREVVLRISARAPERAPLDRLGAELASLLLSGPPGLTGFAGGRPRASEVIGFWPALLDRRAVEAVVAVGADDTVVPAPPAVRAPLPPRPVTAPDTPVSTPGRSTQEQGADVGGGVRLGDLALARSGDKGDDANIGVWTHDETTYAHLLRVVTPERVAAHLASLGASGVTRYEVPRLLALNFVVHDALDGGGAVSLRTDAQGKTLSLGLLEMLVDAPPRPPATAPADPTGTD